MAHPNYEKAFVDLVTTILVILVLLFAAIGIYKLYTMKREPVRSRCEEIGDSSCTPMDAR